MRVPRVAALGLLAAISLVAEDPFATSARARVFLFVRTDCPITNRYAPELQRIAYEFSNRQVDFWLVYPDSTETEKKIQTHMAEYKLPGKPLRDASHGLAKRADASISPQAAVFDNAGQLQYSGRIDDRYVSFGKARTSVRTHDLEAAIAKTLEGKPVAEPRTRAIGCYLADLK